LPISNFLRLSGRCIRVAAEIAVFTALIVGTRCSNYADVFVDGKIYFVDADCYSRMTRARLVAEHPGTVVRRHDFENFPAGVTPHTTALLDYLIVALASLLAPFTAQPLDLAGALVSPMLALFGGWFLWWWSRRFAWPGRVAMLLVYVFSGILVHGTELGRPDHQALLIVTLLGALGAEWRLQENHSRGWAIVSGISWGLALWVSLYEPLVLLGGLILCSLVLARSQLAARPRRIGWWVLFGILLLDAAVERRCPEWPGSQPFFDNWSATIGELRAVRLTNPVWLFWGSGLLLPAPMLLALAWRRRTIPRVIVVLVTLSFCLTLWEARWAYFFALIFVLTIPAQIAIVRPGWLAGLTIVLALCPFLQFWDERLWPNEKEETRRGANRIEAVQWRAAAASLAGGPPAPIMAPWWLAPATAYWSDQPVVAGSSHESLPGIIASARFYLSVPPQPARQILQEHGVRWVLAYDGERVAENSAALLGIPAPANALCRTLDRSPSQAPAFLRLASENGTCKIYQVQGLP
jgi:hypothetical protein